MGTTAHEQELTVRRTIQAPREDVFQAFLAAEPLRRWFGPDGFETRTQEIDARKGGSWRLTMLGPDGTEYPNWVRYVEFVAPELLVWDQGQDGDATPWHRTTVRFEPTDEGTVVTLLMRFPDAASLRRAVEDYGAVRGGQQTLARLAAYIEGMRVAHRLEVSRIIPAPLDKVFAAFLDKEAQVMERFAPNARDGKPMRVVLHALDPRVGGEISYSMVPAGGPDDTGHRIDGRYVDIVGNKRIVQSQQSPDGPPTTVTFLFEAVAGGTKVTIRHEGLPDAGWAEGAKHGWGSALDNLAAAWADRAATQEAT